ncbi:acetate--CoA ligase family protein [Halomonas piscis]|uniref:acetate--CoA ligase family protein n=1 Tax=Halomonas piscis TaxID=3031727 RepID=UPI00289BAF8B|nr:acetate--CoA ligase family protein [Halomonas piscis]
MTAIDDPSPGKSPLHALLAPDSVAVIGASNNPAKRGYKAMLGLVRGGYAGTIYPINPKADAVLDVRAWPSIDAVPEAPALALICTPAATVPELVEACGRRGVKGAIILASGFGEAGADGARLEEEMLRRAWACGVRLIGPNTSGVFNLHHRLNLLALDRLQPGDIGVVSQSGNMLLSLALEAEHHGQVGFSTYVGPGNQSDLGFADYLRYLGEDPATRVATLYIEGFNDGRAFLDTARRVSATKPVVVYKSGATAQGQRSASSHTGALAGSYPMTVDLLRQAGVSVVSYSDDILPVAEGLGRLQRSPGRRVAVIADGGGQATIAADRLAEAGLELATLAADTRKMLAAVLFFQASTVNPVDVAGTTDDHPSLLATCMEIVAADPGVDAVLLVGMFGGYARRFDESLADDEMRGAEAMVELAGSGDKPVVVYSLYAPAKPPALGRLRQAGVPVYDAIENAVNVLAALGDRGAYLDRPLEAPSAPARPGPRGQDLVANARHEGRHLLEPEAKALLAEYGIGVLEERLVRDADELAEAARAFAGTPVAMKVVSPDISHKSDAGGVALNLEGEAALTEAYADIMRSAGEYAPQARIDGVLVTPMAPQGVEVIVGLMRDPTFGPVVMFGLGGVLVEVLEDVAFRAAPLSRGDAAAMLDQLKARRVLDGVRGAPGVDKNALIELLLSVSRLMEAYPAIAELDLNPVIAYPDGYAVVDARILLANDVESAP